MLRHLPLIIKNCWRNRRRTALTVLSVGVSLCLLGVLMAIYHAFYFSDPTPNQALRLVTRNKVALTVPLPQFYRAKIKAIPGVREVEIEQWFGGKYIDNRPEHMFARMAVEPDKFFTIYGEAHISDDQKKAFEQERSACVVGRELAEKYNWKLGDRITLKGDIFPFNLELTLRGIFDAPEDAFLNRSLYFNREYLEQSLPLARRGNAGTFAILAASTDDVPRIEAAVDDQFRNSPEQTKTETESAFALSFIAFLGNIKVYSAERLRRRHLHDSAGIGQHHRHVGARAGARGRRAEDPGVHPRDHPGHHSGRGRDHVADGRGAGYRLGRGHDPWREEPSDFQRPARDPDHRSPGGVRCAWRWRPVIGLVSAFVPAYSASRISIVDALRRRIKKG